MFVVRYLMAVLAVMVGITAWGITAGYSAWQTLGMAVLSDMVLQMESLAYVAVAATSTSSPPRVSTPCPATLARPAPPADAAGKDRPAHFITCAKGDIGPSYDRGSWIVEMDSGTIAMNWFDSVLLILERVR